MIKTPFIIGLVFLFLFIGGYQHSNNFGTDKIHEVSDDLQPQQANSGSPLIWRYESEDQIYSVAISSDGEYIVAGQDLTNSKILFFNRTGRTPLWDYTTGNRVIDVAISANGTHIAAVSHDMNLYFFNKMSNVPVWVSSGNGGNHVAMSTDGTYIVASIGTRVYFFERTSASWLWQYRAPEVISSVDISSDGEFIVAGCQDDNIYLFNRSGQSLPDATPFRVYSTNCLVLEVSISSDGNYIAATNWDVSEGTSNVYLYEKSNSSPIWTYNLFNDNYIPKKCLKISSDGNYVLAGTHEKTLLLFNKTSSIPIWDYTHDGAWWEAVDISYDGSIFVGSNGGIIMLFEMPDLLPKWYYNVEWSIEDLDITPDGKNVVVGSGNHYVYFFSRNQSRSGPSINGFNTFLVCGLLGLISVMLVKIRIQLNK
ncbi:hypothetical protein ES705_04400 [subsurface metagenome]